MEALIAGLIVGAVIFGLLGVFIASQKHRDGAEGFVLGLFFGPLGCLIEALLPTLPPPAPPPPPVPKTPEEIALQRHRAIAAESQRKEEERIRIERERQQHEVLMYALFGWIPELWAWFARVVLKFGWYRSLPSILQPITLGIGIALPVVCYIAWLFTR